jgi:hypothetical protein
MNVGGLCLLSEPSIRQKIKVESTVEEFISYDDQLRQAEDRLRYENIKQKLTLIVKLSL